MGVLFKHSQSWPLRVTLKTTGEVSSTMKRTTFSSCYMGSDDIGERLYH